MPPAARGAVWQNARAGRNVRRGQAGLGGTKALVDLLGFFPHNRREGV
jgi:hypothetical protein